MLLGEEIPFRKQLFSWASSYSTVTAPVSQITKERKGKEKPKPRERRGRRAPGKAHLPGHREPLSEVGTVSMSSHHLLQSAKPPITRGQEEMWVGALITLAQLVRREGSRVGKQLPGAHMTLGLPKTSKASPPRATQSLKEPANKDLQNNILNILSIQNT